MEIQGSHAGLNINWLEFHANWNSQESQDLKVWLDDIKLTEENNLFLDPPPKGMKIKTKVNKWTLMKLKTFAHRGKP